MIKPTILMCGYTGVGKTSIAQAIFGKEIVGEDKIGHLTSVTQDYIKYENNVITIYDSKSLEPDKGEDEFIKKTKEFIRNRQESENIHNHINIFWYVIPGSGARVTDTDIKIINTFRKDSTMVIISKKDITKIKQLEVIKEELLKNGVSQENIIAVSYDEDSGENEGMSDVMNRTHILFPEASKVALDETTIQNIKKSKNTTDNIIKPLDKKSISDNQNTIPNDENIVDSTNENSVIMIMLIATVATVATGLVLYLVGKCKNKE